MIKKYPNRVLASALILTEPDIAFLSHLPQAASALNRVFESRGWAFINDHNGVLFRQPEDPSLFVVTFNQVFHAMLGLNPWLKRHRERIEVTKVALENMKVEKVTRCSFKVGLFADLEMTHQELVGAMFGSFLPSSNNLDSISRDFFDCSVRLFGTRNDCKFELTVSPQTSEQVKTTVYNWPNLLEFNSDRRQCKETTAFCELVERPSLYIELDLFQEAPSMEGTLKFLSTASDTADEIISFAADKFLSK